MITKKLYVRIYIDSGDKMKKNDVKKPISNYVLLFSASILTIWLSWYVFKIYTTYLIEKDNVLSKFISEISYDELPNYIMDNPDAIVYLSANDNNNYTVFEKDFMNYIKENNLINAIVYFDTKKIEENDLITIKATYFEENLTSANFDTFPNLIIFENGKVVDILYKDKEDITLEKIKNIIEKYEETDD